MGRWRRWILAPTAFVLAISGVARAGVVINEVYPNPIESSDAGYEWLELFNPGPGSVDLDGWTVEAGTSTYASKYTIPGGTTLAQGEWLVIGDEFVASADLELGASATLGLGNGSDTDGVRLKDGSGTVVDTVLYSSPNNNGWLDDTGVAASSFAANPSSGQSIARVSDGVDSNQSGADFAKTATPTPGASNGGGGTSCEQPGADLVINEFLPAPDGTDEGQEWVELYNRTSAAVDVGGWMIVSGTSSFSAEAAIPAGTAIGSNGFLLVGHSGVLAADVVVDDISLGNASSSGDAVRLEDCQGTVIDTVVYGPDNADSFVDDSGEVASSIAPKPGDGDAVARIEDGGDSDASGVDFQLAPYPTPGASNTAPLDDCGAAVGAIKINEVYYDIEGADAGLEWLELYNAGNSAMSVQGWTVQTVTTDEWADRVELGAITLEAGDYLLIGGELVTSADVIDDGLTIPNGDNGDGVRITDCNGYVADTVAYGKSNDDQIVDDSGDAAVSMAPDTSEGEGSLQRLQDGLDTNQCGDDFAIQASPTPGAANPVIDYDPCVPSDGSVAINEIMPDPTGEDADAEWLELYNAGDEPVSISGWYLSIATVAPEEQGAEDVSFGSGVAVPAGGFLVIGGAFEPEVNLVKSFTLGNGDDGDAVQLYDCAGALVDTVVYGDSNSSGMIDDQGEVPAIPYGAPDDGRTLARLEDGVDADVVTDWFVDPTPTPGATNVSSIDVGGDTDDDAPSPPTGGCGASPDSPRGCESGAVLGPWWMALLLVRRAGRRS